MFSSLRLFCCAAPGTGLPAVGNAIHAISIHDVASDTVHQFAPTYRDYVLYSDKHDDDGSLVEAPKRTFRAKTFVQVEAASPLRIHAALLQRCRDERNC